MLYSGADDICSDDISLVEAVGGEPAELAHVNRFLLWSRACRKVVQSNLLRCVEISNLTRKFKMPGLEKSKMALDKLDLTLYEVWFKVAFGCFAWIKLHLITSLGSNNKLAWP